MKSTDSHFASSWSVALRLNGHLLGCWKQISASLRGEGTFQTMLTDCLTLSCQGLEPSALLDPEECQMYWPPPNEVLSTWWDFPGFLKQLVNKQCVNELTWDEDPSAPAKPPNTYKAHGLSELLMWSSLVSLAHKSRKDDVFVLRHQFGAQFVIQPIDASNKSHIWKEGRVSGKLGRLGTALNRLQELLTELTVHSNVLWFSTQGQTVFFRNLHCSVPTAHCHLQLESISMI